MFVCFGVFCTDKENDLNTKLANIYTRLEEIGADEAESKAAQILSGIQK